MSEDITKTWEVLLSGGDAYPIPFLLPVSEDASSKLAIEGRWERGFAICCLLSAFETDFFFTLCTEMLMIV